MPLVIMLIFRRQRSYSPSVSPYELLQNTLSSTSTGVTGRLLNSIEKVEFNFELLALDDNTLRLKITEASPIRPRYEIPVGDVLIKEPKAQRYALEIVLLFCT